MLKKDGGIEATTPQTEIRTITLNFNDADDLLLLTPGFVYLK